MPPGTPLHVRLPPDEPAGGKGMLPSQAFGKGKGGGSGGGGGGSGGKGDKSIMNRLKNMLP